MRGNLLLFPDILYPTVCSPLWKVLFGQRFDRSEYDIPGEICSLAMMFVQSLDSMGGAMSFFPFLRHFGNMFGFKNMIKGQHGVANIIRVNPHTNITRATSRSTATLHQCHVVVTSYIAKYKVIILM